MTARKPKDQHKKTGRPSLYKPEYVQMLLEHMSEGRPFETFAAIIGVHRDTLYEWRDVHPEFSDAAKIGKEMSFNWWFEKGRTNLIINPDEKFNTSVYIFMMKAIHGMRDGSESRHNLENPIGKTKEQLEEYKKEVDQLREALEIRNLKLVVPG